MVVERVGFPVLVDSIVCVKADFVLHFGALGDEGDDGLAQFSFLFQ